MPSKLKNREMDQLFDAILSLKSREECYSFFSDVCTISELQAMAQRLEVARLLSTSMTYLDISNVTGASSATVSRVGRALHYGEDGYTMVLDRLKEKDPAADNS